jgi:predicted lipid-binding transport protein (Tim44 family)
LQSLDVPFIAPKCFNANKGKLFGTPEKVENIVTFEIVLLAMVAAFLGLRLYSVLGKRTGHEQETIIRKPVEERAAPVIREPVADAAPTIPRIQTTEIPVEMAAESGLRSIQNADRQFDAGLFIEGAKSAYGMILEAFWRGDRDALKALCDDDVYDSFDTAITAREERGEILENRLVRIENARIVDASLDHPTARITVRFDADIAALVKDGDGNMIGGSMTDAIETNDVWTFMRNVKDTTRNWKLDETDEA